MLGQDPLLFYVAPLGSGLQLVPLVVWVLACWCFCFYCKAILVEELVRDYYLPLEAGWFPERWLNVLQLDLALAVYFPLLFLSSILLMVAKILNLD